MEKGISVFIGAVTDEKVKTAAIVERLKGVPGVRTIYELTGNLDVMILAQSDSLPEINGIVEAVRACSGVKETTTYMVLETTQNDRQ
jgi:DNA-binding Lrp family transcriptional regulator